MEKKCLVDFLAPLCSRAALCHLPLWLTFLLFTSEQWQYLAVFIYKEFVEKLSKPQYWMSHYLQNSIWVLMAPFPPLWRKTLESEKGFDFTLLLPSKILSSFNGAFLVIPIFHDLCFMGFCWLASHCMENQTF